MRFKKKKKTLADYFAISDKSTIISTFSLFLIVISLPITLLLLMQRTHYEEHAAGTNPTSIQLTRPTSFFQGGDTPTVFITNPVNGSVLKSGSTVTITVSVSDTMGIAMVMYMKNGIPICTVASFPYACTWVVPGKSGVSYTITANAYNKAGNRGTNTVVISTQQ